MTRLVSNSEVQTFKSCRRRWWLSYVRGMKLKQEETAGARSLGTLVHRSLEAYYAGTGPDPLSIIDAAQEEALAGTEEVPKELSSQFDLARAMVEGYLEWVLEEGADEGLTVIAAEESVQVPFTRRQNGEEVNLVGRLDARMHREVDDAELFMDHKTVGDLTRPLKTLHMDEQMLTYLLILKMRDKDTRTDGAIYNMLRKVKRTSNAKPPFYGRAEQRHSVTTLRSFFTRLTATVSLLLDAEERLKQGGDHLSIAFPTPTNDCSWRCDHFPVCPMFDDGSNAEGLLETYYVYEEPYTRYGDVVSSETTTTTDADGG